MILNFFKLYFRYLYRSLQLGLDGNRFAFFYTFFTILVNISQVLLALKVFRLVRSGLCLT